MTTNNSALKTAPAFAARHLLLMALTLLAVFPLYWMVISSFKGPGEILGAALLPRVFTTENYSFAFKEMPIGKMLVNSFIAAFVIAAVQICTALLAAYGLTRWDFRGKSVLYGLLTFSWIIPFQAIMIPNYVQINAWGLKGSLFAIALPYLASAFSCISMYQAFQSFPRALIDAARMDHSSELQILFNIILPNMRASIASLAILLFINAWNEYMWPMLVVNDLESSPIQIGLKAFVGSDTNMWGSLMAATTVSCLPILTIYMLMQRNIINSFMKWGIK